MKHICSSIEPLFFLDEAALRDVYSIEELATILLSGVHALVDEGARARDGCVVDAFDNELVLVLGRGLDRDSGHHVDKELGLAAKEVPDLDGLLVLSRENLDRKVRVHKSHFVAVSLQRISARVRFLTLVTPVTMLRTSVEAVFTTLFCL